MVYGLATDTKLEDLNILVTSTIVGGTAINNTVNNTVISGTDFGDNISNSGSNVTINALAGRDSVSNLYGNYASINGGDGNDTIANYCSDVTINGDSGNDYIHNSGNNVTINGGTGDDTITLSGGNATYQYNEGDGNDVIIGFTTSDTLVIGSTSSETFLSGNDWIFKAGENTITLKDAATLAPNTVFDNDADNTVITGTAYADIINNTGANVTIRGNGWDDTITNTGDNVVYQYSAGDGNDLIIGFTANDTLIISSDTYRTSISGNDLIVSIVSSQNTITLKDAANITPKIKGEKYGGYLDKEGHEIENPVAQIESGGVTYYYESVARATNDADNNSTVTVTANSTETAQINATKDLTIQFAESGLGVYNVTGGNFVSADNSAAAQLSVDSNRVTSNSNTLQLRNGATATLDGYEVTRISNRYSVIGNSFDNNISNSGERVTINAAEGNDSISNTGNNVSVVGGAGNDSIVNAGDNVSIEGNDGDDYILSGGNNSSINAGAGNDTLLVTEDIATNELIEIEGGDGNDSILAASIENNGELEIDGDEGNDLITVTHVSNKGLLEIDGDDGDDIISVTNIMDNSGKIDIEGDTGNDSIIIARLAADIAINISGDAGNDSITLTANAPATESSKAYTVSGGAGNDTITGDGADFIYQYDSGDGNDVIIGFTDSDTLLVDGTQYRARTSNEDFIVNVAEDANAIAAKDKATFIIADSKVVSVDGFAAISGLSNATVHVIGNVAVNNSDIDVTGDNDFNVIVSDGKTSGLANISAGASLSVAGMNVTTDNNGDFKVGEYVYSVNDTVDGSVTFITNNKAAVENIIGLNGSLKTTARTVTVNGSAFNSSNTDVTISSAGANITRVEGLNSGDTISGNLDSSTVAMPATQDTDTSVLTINERNYILGNDSDGVLITGNRIDGLNSGASLTVGAAGSYLVNNTALDAVVGDVFIGTAEGAAYIYDPNNIPLNVDTMADDEIAAQVGISTDYAIAETNTEKAAALIKDASKLDGNMELAISNSDTTTAQTADFSNSTGKKKITLAEGSQEVKFNDEGGNVAVIESDSAGEKNITLGNGGNLVIVKDTETPVNIMAGSGKDTVVTAGNNVKVSMKGGATRIVPNGGNVEVTNYDAATGAGIQIDAFSDIRRAIVNDNISLNNGAISFVKSTVVVNNTYSESTMINLYDNKGIKQKIAYTHSDGGKVDASGERENLLLVGNKNMDKGNAGLISGSGNDSALGGAGDYFDLGAGNNRIYLSENRNGSERGSTVAMTTNAGRTEVFGFVAGFGETADSVNIDVMNSQVSYTSDKLTFNIGNASLIINFANSSDLADSADLIADDNFICDTRLDDITPINYEQGEYQNLYDTTFATARDTFNRNICRAEVNQLYAVD